MKIKVNYDCEEDNAEIMTIEAFVNKFNKEEINSSTDMIELIKE